MNGNRFSEYQELILEMHKEFSVLNREFEQFMITDNGLNSLYNLEKFNKIYQALVKEIKNNPSLYKEKELNKVSKDIMDYKNMILNAKKLLIYYYNLLVYSINKEYQYINDNKANNRAVILFDNKNIPKYYDRFISNYQDKISLNFNELNQIRESLVKIEKKMLLPRKNKHEMELEYIRDYAIKRIDKSIQLLGDAKDVTKSSIENDILWLSYELHNLKNKIKKAELRKDIFELLGSLELAKGKLCSHKSVNKNYKDNEEYYDIRYEMEFFLREINDYLGRIKLDSKQYSDNLFDEINHKLDKIHVSVKDLPDKIKKDKVLMGNLDKLLDTLNKQVNQIPFYKTDINEQANLDYLVTEVKDGKDIYKKMGKKVLISSALATIGLLIPKTMTFVLPGIIAVNASLIEKYPVMGNINEILASKIQAKKDKDGTWYNKLGSPITKMSSMPELLKGVVVNSSGHENIASDVVDKINIVSNVSLRKQELLDKKAQALYKKYELSELGFRDFCNKEKLTPDLIKRLADYLVYESEENERERSR